ncbi:sugar-transfer associated ATP-grasp domain-containing protein [Proteinivorax tanatarense]|uniref:acylphosphatase n=1 Tax=Proteinivorax tanatarense TaxID=1260629 RepID=A0AAU7VHZ4_9FIRM
MGKKRTKNKRPNMLPNLLVFSLLRRPKNAADIIHRTYAVCYWQHCRTLKSRLKVVIYFLLSPLFILKDINKWSKKVDIKTLKSEKTAVRQYMEQFYLSFFYSINAENYYLQEFYAKEGLQKARYFVNKGAIKNGTYKILTKYGQYINNQYEVVSLGKKVEFSNFCINNKVPVVPIIQEILSDGTIIAHHSKYINKELPEESLFCKPNIDNEGQGAEIWNWVNGRYQNPQGDTLSKNQLKAYLKNLAQNHKSGSILVQPLILPHPKLAVFRKNATPTIRVLSYVDEAGHIELDQAMLRFSIDTNSVVDNASAGGMVAPINMNTGTLGPAIHSDVSVSNTRMDKLSDDLEIRGVKIPYWAEALSLVKDVHKNFPYRLVVGWDIVITDKGPVLLEGNNQAGICFIQRAHGKTIGQTKTGQAMANHADKALQVLYNGVIGEGQFGQGKIDLYEGSTFKKALSWFILKNEKTIELTVSGQVQNVGYRNWLQTKAKSLKVSGWVQNNHDRTVTAVLKGRALDIEWLVRECYIGPKKAKVKSITVKWGENYKDNGFRIIR